jgi:prevent-host-death family protein
MSTHSVAEAKNKLSQLIKRALAGEAVIITRHGDPVIELKPVKAAPRPITASDLEWLRTHRVARLDPDKNADEIVREMREERGA